MRLMGHYCLLGPVLALGLASGCARERATGEACSAILDRIVYIELQEQGFRDPALASRKREELRRVLHPELARCQGRGLPEGALACVERAQSAEEISHVCLR